MSFILATLIVIQIVGLALTSCIQTEKDRAADRCGIYAAVALIASGVAIAWPLAGERPDFSLGGLAILAIVDWVLTWFAYVTYCMKSA